MSACSELPYYLQSAQGQWDITQRKQSISELIHDFEQNRDSSKLSLQATKLNAQLTLVQEARKFAIATLNLPETNSFTQYADLERDYVVKNLFAATEFSTELISWCYPIIGCANYRGYFDQAMLDEYKTQRVKQGDDIYIAKVSAYSTLGWFDDPVLNTFVDLPEYRLVSLIIHEISHQQLYIDDDTAFNESFASAVEQAGIKQWFESHDNLAQLQTYLDAKTRRQDIFQLIASIREDLKQLYKQNIDESEMRQKKQKRLELAVDQYNSLKASYGLSSNSGLSNSGKLNSDKLEPVKLNADKSRQNKSAYDNWFAQGLNNAKLGSVTAYTIYVEAFLSMLTESNNHLPKFYAHAAAIGELEREQRHACLTSWAKRTYDIAYPIEKPCLYLTPAIDTESL